MIVFDTTCLSSYSGRVRRVVTWARRAKTPVILVRSHTKLNSLGIEYGRLGSAMFLSFPDMPAVKTAKPGSWHVRSESWYGCSGVPRSQLISVHLPLARSMSNCKFAGTRRYSEIIGS